MMSSMGLGGNGKVSKKVSKGLGKGLDSLIKENIKAVSEKKEDSKVRDNEQSEMLVKISLVEPNREQPRKMFEEDALLELSESIQQFGVLQPILVQKKEDYYEIIAGERRWRAAKMAGLKEVPVICKNFTPQEILEISLIENIQRENLNPIEEAYAYKRLLEEFKLKQDEVAERVSKSRAAITNSLRLLKLDEKVQKMLIDEMISSGHARALLAITDKKTQRELANRIFDEKLSVREVEKIVKNFGKSSKKRSVEESEIEKLVYRNIEEQLKNIMGTKVVVNNKGKKGKIEIEYYSNEELERLIDLIKTIQIG